MRVIEKFRLDVKSVTNLFSKELVLSCVLREPVPQKCIGASGVSRKTFILKGIYRLIEYVIKVAIKRINRVVKGDP